MRDGKQSAFPLPHGSETSAGSEGMSLRAYFAAKAIQGLCANDDYADAFHNTDDAAKRLVEHAKRIADHAVQVMKQ